MFLVIIAACMFAATYACMRGLSNYFTINDDAFFLSSIATTVQQLNDTLFVGIILDYESQSYSYRE